MQLVVGINNTQNNYFVITTENNDKDLPTQVIGHELTFVASPLNVTLMSFNNLITQQKNYIENKLLESQENGSGWTLHNITFVLLLLVLNPKNISSVGLRKLVGGLYYDYEFDMDKWGTSNNLILNEGEVDGDGGTVLLIKWRKMELMSTM